MKESDICSHCGKKRSEHHDFVAIVVPRDCKCDPTEWAYPDRIPPVCTRYESMTSDPELCRNCEHTEECHAP